MNVWTKRLIGLLILLVIGLVIFDNWFTPDVPPALQQDISLEVAGESQTIPPPPTPPTATPPHATQPPARAKPPLTTAHRPPRQKNPNRAKAVPGYRQAPSTAKKTPTT